MRKPRKGKARVGVEQPINPKSTDDDNRREQVFQSRFALIVGISIKKEEVPEGVIGVNLLDAKEDVCAHITRGPQ